MAPLSTAGTPPLCSYIQRTHIPTCPDLAPCLEHLQAPCLEHLQSTISSTPSSHSPPCILFHTFSHNPTNLTMVTVSGISKGFVVVGLPTRTRRCSLPTRRWTTPLVG